MARRFIYILDSPNGEEEWLVDLYLLCAPNGNEINISGSSVNIYCVTLMEKRE